MGKSLLVSEKVLTVRVPKRLMDALKLAAKEKGCGYSTLVRMWLIEKLKEEGIKPEAKR